LIKSLVIQNFQSHKKTSLTFHPGINIITGDTDSGKTSIIRAIYWARFNRPNGDEYISNWNRDNKGKPVKPTAVIIENDNCKIKRVKSADMNGYKIYTSEEPLKLEAVGMDIPEEIPKLLNIDDTNIQMQLDPPFLLSKSYGDVAKYFNSIIRLDLIDKVLSKAETKRRENNANKKQVEISIKEVEDKLETYDYLEAAEELINKIDKIENRINKNTETINAINNLKIQLATYDKIISKSNSILSAAPLIQKIKSLQSAIDEKAETLTVFSSNLREWTKYNKIIDGAADFDLIDNLIEKINTLRINTFDKVKKVENIRRLIDEYNAAEETIENAEKEIRINIKLLPKTCPLCGSKL
jgi:exonuclease SbcC